MTTRLSRIASALGLDENSTLEKLLEPDNHAFKEYLDGIPSSSQSRDLILEVPNLAENYHIATFTPITPAASCWVTKIRLTNHTLPVIIGTYSTQIQDSIPDELEMLTLWAAIDERDIFNNQEDFTKAKWRTTLNGKTLVAFPKSLNEKEKTNTTGLLEGLFGFQPQAEDTSQHLITELQKVNEIILGKPVESISKTTVQLIYDIAAATSAKWRMLSMYRILENGYLNNIRDEFLHNFDRQPSMAVKKAQESIASETNQLVSLAETKNLQTEFELFSDEFDKLTTAGHPDFSQFAIAIDRELRADKSPLFFAQERYKKGVARLYKIRCAIAHAGTASIIYEQFNDADMTMNKLHPPMSAIVQKLLAIQVAYSQPQAA